MATGWSSIEPAPSPGPASSRRMALWPQTDPRQKRRMSSSTTESKPRRSTGGKDWVSR
ncbi:hypothetical protein [Lysobacter gummosus]|uniref:hypothetical protein n=1 Tax=Lysobacter gummosus TaxID=262324 RepID=UPI00362E1B8D